MLLASTLLLLQGVWINQRERRAVFAEGLGIAKREDLVSRSTDSAALSDSTEGSSIGEKLANIKSKAKKPRSPSSSGSSCRSPSRTSSPVVAYSVYSDSSVSSVEQDNGKAPARSSEDGPIKKVTAAEKGRAGKDPKAKPARKTATTFPAKRANKPNPDLKRPASQTNRGIHRY